MPSSIALGDNFALGVGSETNPVTGDARPALTKIILPFIKTDPMKSLLLFLSLFLTLCAREVDLVCLQTGRVDTDAIVFNAVAEVAGALNAREKATHYNLVCVSGRADLGEYVAQSGRRCFLVVSVASEEDSSNQGAILSRDDQSLRFSDLNAIEGVRDVYVFSPGSPRFDRLRELLRNSETSED
jgi:hypothetical protein